MSAFSRKASTASLSCVRANSARSSKARLSSSNDSARKAVLSDTNWTGVLISWATPAASWPIASSFWAWLNWAWATRRFSRAVSTRLWSASAKFQSIIRTTTSALKKTVWIPAHATGFSRAASWLYIESGEMTPTTACETSTKAIEPRNGRQSW